MRGSGAEHEKKFKEDLEAVILQKELTIKNSERETVKAFLQDKNVEVKHVFLQTQLQMVHLLLSKAADFKIKIDEKVEYLRKAHHERWQKAKAALMEVQKKVKHQDDMEIL